MNVTLKLVLSLSSYFLWILCTFFQELCAKEENKQTSWSLQFERQCKKYIFLHAYNNSMSHSPVLRCSKCFLGAWLSLQHRFKHLLKFPTLIQKTVNCIRAVEKGEYNFRGVGPFILWYFTCVLFSWRLISRETRLASSG